MPGWGARPGTAFEPETDARHFCEHCHLRRTAKKRNRFCSRACERDARRARRAEPSWRLRKVCKGSPSECWPWTGAVNLRGYGKLQVQRRTVAAHRIAYECEYGAIPDGMFVCHRCDNPRCCNPAHLFLGTHEENMADMVSKGRARNSTRRGESSPNHKLTDAAVRAIREGIASGALTVTAAAKLYGVSTHNVSEVARGRAWKHVKPETIDEQCEGCPDVACKHYEVAGHEPVCARKRSQFDDDATEALR